MIDSVLSSMQPGCLEASESLSETLTFCTSILYSILAETDQPSGIIVVSQYKAAILV